MDEVIDAVLWKLGWRRRSSAHRHRAIFTRVYRRRAWGDGESVSGPGSTEASAAAVRADVLRLLGAFGVSSVVDAPCGDFNWTRTVLGDRVLSYVGVDVVDELIVANRERYGDATRHFLRGDLTRDPLPRADLVLSRDALVHFSFADIRAAIDNFRRSGSTYLLATTFIGARRNLDIRTGDWRTLNMQAPPFAFPPPLAVVDEQCTRAGGIYRDKRLALWKLSDLPE